MDAYKWIILLLQVWMIYSARVRRKSGPTDGATDPLSSGDTSPATSAGTTNPAPNTSDDYPYYPETDKDVEPWLQNEMYTSLEVDYNTNRDLLRRVPEPYEIVYPVQVRRNQQIQLDTKDYKNRNKNLHYHHTSLQLTMFGRRLKIKLELNKDLLSAGLRQKRHVDETTQMITEGPVEHCYYKGRIRRLPESRVVLSTCSGVSGIIQLINETFIIQPLRRVMTGVNETRFPHVVYDASLADSSECANKRGMWHPFTELHRGEFLKTTKILKAQQTDRDILQERKFMELALVLDHTMYMRMNYTYSRALHYLIQMANILDSYYNELGVQIQLVMVDVWNLRDVVARSHNVRRVLRDFLLYRERSLMAVPHDLAHLITGGVFDGGETGMSVPDSVCSQRSVSVGRDPTDLDPQHAAAIAAHYMGHALGLSHDDNKGCSCPDPNGCIMAHNILKETVPPPRHFSLCSMRAINSSLLAGLGSCLFKKPLAMTYPQTCGNNRLERGEECDCGNAEECAVNDPCCDPESCLLRPWATCRTGACCLNCTVRPSSHVCRQPLTECDVPEFCSGMTGKCPDNALVQDGQPCRQGSASCYKGFCHTHADQCYALWGEGATQAVDKCYERFNPTGNFNGHCGKDLNTGSHQKCELSNIKCGLLHCMGGGKEPRVTIKKAVTLTTMMADGETFQCKVVNSRTSTMPYLGMVEDGTRCGDHSFCINASCMRIEDVVKGACPDGGHNATCSGRGVCTSDLTCFCDRGYGGVACERQVNKTTTVWMRPTTPPLVTTPTPTPSFPPQTVWYRVLTTTAYPAPVVVKERTGVSTTWLVIVLAGVVGAGIILFVASIVCYRRQSPNKLMKAQKRKLFFNRIVPPTFKPDGSVASEDIPRLISFGNMPSYKADKIKSMRKSGVSETGSEHSAGSQRDATEMKVLHTTLPLAKPPERGILKKFPRSADDLLEMVALAGGACSTPTHLSSFTDLNAERQRLLRPIPMRDAATQGNTLEEGEYESLVSAQSDSSLDKKEGDELLTPSDDDNDSCFKPTPTPSPPDSGKEEGSGSGGGGGKSDSSSGSKRSRRSGSVNNQSDAEKSRAQRMQNIEDLIRQIDAQASTLAKQTSKGYLKDGRRQASLSPSTSEDAEFDRLQQPPKGLYHYLSDCEEEGRSPRSPQSPSNLSPSHHYMPKPMPRLQRQYNPLQVDIPQNVGPFSILENQPGLSHHNSNLGSASRRFPSSSSTLTAVTPSSPRDVYKAPPVAPLFYRTRTNSRSESPGPQLSPGALSTSSKLSTFSQLSRTSSTPPRPVEPPMPPLPSSTQPLQSVAGRRNSPTNPFSGSPFSMRRSPELNLASLPLQPVNPLPHLGTLERRSPPARPPDRSSPSTQRDSPRSGFRKTSSPSAAKPGSVGAESKSSSPKPSPLPRSTPVKPRMPSPRTDRKVRPSEDSCPARSDAGGYNSQGSPSSNSSPNNTLYGASPIPHGSPRLPRTTGSQSSSPQPSGDGQHPLTAIPYRGAKNLHSGSPPTSLNRSTDSSSDAETPKTSSPKPPPRNPHAAMQNKLTHPLLDGYPFRASHHSLTPDIASNSEGYHSDKTENDDSIIIREIPSVKPDSQLASHRRSAYKSGHSDSIDL